MRVLGWWYSNNRLHPGPIASSLDAIDRAQQQSEIADVTVRTSTWDEMPSSPFKGYKTYFQLGVHFGIVIQILKILYEEERAGATYDVVAFLEHDVLYPDDYFDRIFKALEDIPDKKGVSNLDYIGLNHTGWVAGAYAT